MRPRIGFGAQRRALLDPEPMLLVDDDQAEIGKLNIRAEQGVGTDDYPSCPRRSMQGGLTAARRRRGTSDQHDTGGMLRSIERAAGGEVAEHPGDGLVMLSG